MTAAKKATRKPSKTRTKSAGKSAAVVKRPQPHGGALLPGGVPGNKGGTGRPPSELRARLVGSFAERVGVIEQIADGKPVKRAEVPLSSILLYARCPKCEGTFESTTDTPSMMIALDGIESASPGDRLKALDLAAKYGLGTKDELTVVSPDVQARLQRQVDVIHRLLPAEQANALLDALTAEVWTE